MDNYFIVLGHPVPKIKIYISVASIVLLATALIGGFYYILLDKNAQNQDDATSSSLQTADSDKELPEFSEFEGSLAKILKTHMEATGIGKLKDFTMHGTPWDDRGQKREISIKALKPNLYKFKISYLANGEFVEFGYDGKQGWMEKTGTNKSYPNEATDRHIVLFLASASHLAWSYQSELAQEQGISTVLELVGMKERNGQMCQVLRSKGLLPFAIDHYIDSETFHEVYRTASIEKPDGGKLSVEVEFKPQNYSDDIRLPLIHKVYQDGEQIDEIVYKSPRTNVVMPRMLFAAPKAE